MNLKFDAPITSPGKTKIKEAVIAGATMGDVGDTMDEFYNVNNEMYKMISSLTVEQRQKLNDVIKDFVSNLAVA